MITLLILLYLQGIVAAISFSTLTLSILSGVLGFIIFVNKERLCEDSKRLFRCGLILLSVSIFTPSKDTLSVAIGLYATSEVIEVVSHSDLAKKALEAINVQLDSLVKTDAKK